MVGSVAMYATKAQKPSPAYHATGHLATPPNGLLCLRPHLWDALLEHFARDEEFAVGHAGAASMPARPQGAAPV